ncbi:putative cytoplasmic protein [Salmonella enterica subsp. enterica]|uniref:Putative cytoplasmic protein n=1 Tax=Salmonella enterica I TaxID=59201 RepID=A0A379WKT2_SALET|nr:putative cytoplasmic protein [Salmonella enterica subsp. enterica]
MPWNLFPLSVSVSLRGVSVTQQKAYESWYDALSDYEQDNPYRVDACYSGDLLEGGQFLSNVSVEDELNQNDTRWRPAFSWDEEIHSTTALLAVAGPDFGGGR